ncbi:hypothetical protein BC749_10779 [Flavobacterium araucananum]|uniref:Uncharacterized protein n=1 Tax=Flavobacterium araucananum TaxID=946678 RepID=A0A227NDC3_9FLAO|nr:hypothetical protein [Flavobacterium araucananum]OXE95603.1 hypothetical protein B0A64_24280 [Flavobacterium araucananum]PWJ97283.1 hypothetical protein BC749_10779 [Flavobacterium araucananum]
MKKIILLLLLISFSAQAQTNRFTGTWSNENCKDCNKEYIFTLNIAQSNSKIFGTAEITSKNEKFVTGVMEVTGYVYALGEKAQISIKSKDGSVSAVLFANDDSLQFDKRGGADLVPKEAILTKLY